MKIIRLVIILWMWAAIPSSQLFAGDTEGVALAIIYDTSGSMKEQVRDGAGKMSPKYVIANRALEGIVQRIQAFATNSAAGGPRNIQAGLFVFNGAGTRQAVPFGPFDPVPFRNWARGFSNPQGSTPLGNALSDAGRTVLNSGLTRKHVLIITDGANTLGPAPASVFPGLKRQAEDKQTTLSVHFVAFDVGASVFRGVKNQGATVVTASDEKQLNQQLEFILAKKILLEEEEPPKQK